MIFDENTKFTSKYEFKILVLYFGLTWKLNKINFIKKEILKKMKIRLPLSLYHENLPYSIVLTVVFCLTIIQLYIRDAEIEKMIAELNTGKNN